MSKYSFLLNAMINVLSSTDADDAFDVVSDLKVIEKLDDGEIEKLSRIYAIIKNKFTQLIDSDPLYVEAYAAIMVSKELGNGEPHNPYDRSSYGWERWEKGKDAALSGGPWKSFKFGPKSSTEA